jgi:hypothetical protein
MINFLCEVISVEGTAGLSSSNCGLPCKLEFLDDLESKIALDIIKIKCGFPNQPRNKIYKD